MTQQVPVGKAPDYLKSLQNILNSSAKRNQEKPPTVVNKPDTNTDLLLP